MDFPRTLIIGIDGATYDLLKPWAEAGLLPTFAHLLQHGAHATLDAYPYLGSATAWTNIITGYNPGQHAILSFTTRNFEPENWRPIIGSDRRKPAFWQMLAASGQRAGVMNVPISFPAENINGFMLSGMDSPSATGAGFSQPRGIYHELKRAGIQYLIDVPNMGETARRGVTTLPSNVRDMTLARTRAFLYLLEKYPCDAAMVVYIGGDRMSHYFWRETPPLPDAPEWRPLRELFQLYDTQLEELLERASGDTTVFIVSDHGFGLLQRGRYGLNTMLQQLGYQAKLTGPSNIALLHTLLKLGRRTIPLQWQRDLAGRFSGLHARAARYDGVYDWANTRAYTLAEAGTISLNMSGRYARGIVPPEEYDALWNELAEVLLGLTNPENGANMIQEVHHSSKYFNGPWSHGASDMYMRWNYPQLGHRMAYRRNGHDIVLAPGGPTSGWIGNHLPEGIFIAYGKGVRPGVAHESITHFELTPTILYLHDQPIPDDMDGRALTEWFEPGFVQQHSIIKTAAPEYTSNPQGLNDSENELVENRLRQLGYIE